MKLHLPKVLFAAVVAAVCCVQQAEATITTGSQQVEVGDTTYNATVVTGSANNGIILTKNDKGDANVTLSEGDTILGFQMTLGTSDKAATTNWFNGTQTYAGDILVLKDSSVTNGYSGLVINNGNQDNVITFAGKVMGDGDIAKTSSVGTGVVFKFTGDMSGYTGNMYLTGNAKDDFIFDGATSGTGTIEVIGTVQVINATMNNSSIEAGTLSVSGTSSFAGTVEAGTLSVSGTSSFAGNVTASTLTLGENAAVTFGEGTVVTVSSGIGGSSGRLILGEGATMVFTGVSSTSALEHDTYGYKTDRTLDLLGGTLKANREVTVTVNGTEVTMAADGSVASLSDNKYYISGDVNASTLNASDDDVSAADSIWMTDGTLTMDEDYTVSGSALITGTTISQGAGKLIVADGATVQVNSTGKILKSNMEIAAGGTMEFLGTGCDAIDYSQTGSSITVAGTMDVGTTRQTVGYWTFNLLGGTIEGAGQASQNNIGLDFHKTSTVNAKAADGASAADPTVSTISTKVRYYNGALTVAVEENARLDVTGAIVAGNKLTKSGAGTLRLANNDNNYGDKAIDVTGGTLEVRDNTVTMSCAVTVNNGASMLIQQTATGANTLANVTLDNGKLLVQNSAGANTTNVTKLTVGAGGATIGTGRDTSFKDASHEGTIVIGSLVASTAEESTLTVESSSNTDVVTTVHINGGPGENETAFSGTVKVQVNPAANTNTGKTRKTNLDLASDTALANAVIELGGGSGDESTYTTNLMLGAAQTAVKGIQDATDRQSQGNVIIRTSSTPSTLTIDTGDASYSTISGVKEAINLVKKGSGTQTFGGDMSGFGTISGETDGNIEIKGGKLAFTKDDGSMTVETLTLNGGTMEVAGTLTLNDLALDLNMYSTDQERHTLVSAGTLNLGEGVDLSTLGATVGNYTASVAQEGNAITLSFEALPVSNDITTTVTSQGGFADGMLTLNVGADLADASKVLITGISDSIMAEILGLSGLPADGMVGITLQGADGSSFTATADEMIGFMGNDGVSYYFGENVEGAWQYQVAYIPEPATATLSLLALMGLAARRRRK